MNVSSPRMNQQYAGCPGVYQRVYQRLYQPPARGGRALCVWAVSVSCFPLPACGCQGLAPLRSATPGFLRSTAKVGSLRSPWPSTGGRFPSTLHRKKPGLRPGTPRTGRSEHRWNSTSNLGTSSSWSPRRRRKLPPPGFVFCSCWMFVVCQPLAVTAVNAPCRHVTLAVFWCALK